MKWRRLSLCMIVRDEEAWIGRCLASVQGVVDEMIIVDTGSTDRTVEICRSYGATVLPFVWQDSFAEARNYGIERATGDWILWLDADEEVEAKDRHLLRDVLYADGHEMLSIHLINYHGETAHEDQAFHMAHTRLFRNGLGIRFKGNIHEAFNLDELQLKESPAEIALVPIKVHHYGYLNPVTEGKKKWERNLRLLQRELQRPHPNVWIEYHIASEYYRAEQYETAFEYVNHSIVRFLREGHLPPSLVYKLKYSILLTLGSLQGAEEGIDRAIALYPDYVDLHFFKGLILYGRGKYEAAKEVFTHCLELGEDNLTHLILKGVGSFQAWYHLGCCEQKLDQLEKAAECYARAIQLSSNYAPPREALQKLEEEQGAVG